MIKASVIIAIYKDIEALSVILESLYNQTTSESYEVIVAEDGESKLVKNYINSLDFPNLKHTSHEDINWRKNKSLNNAIKVSEGEYLMFIDGDCVPSRFFIENYLKKAQKKVILCGRRVELGPVVAKELREKKYTISKLEKSYISNYFKMKKDKVRHYEEGIIFPNFIQELRYKNYNASIIGCNFGVYKEDLVAINGFGESYNKASVGEDNDIEWRFLALGYVMKSIRNRSAVFHLYHDHKYSREDNKAMLNLLEKRKDEKNYICLDGLNKTKI